MVSLTAGWWKHQIFSASTRCAVNHGAAYLAACRHAERCNRIVASAFKEIHLRNLTYFRPSRHRRRKGPPTVDVGVRIFTGMNVFQGLAGAGRGPLRFHGHDVPGSQGEGAAPQCRRTPAPSKCATPRLFASDCCHTFC